MKHFALALAAGLAIATSLGAQTQQPPPAPQQQPQPQTPKAPDVTLTGCLVQGATPATFLIQDAKKDPQSTTEKGMTYVVVAGTQDVSLRPHLNHEVRITGEAETKTPPTPRAGQTVAEKDLAKLTAKAVTMVSNTCSSAAR